MSLKMMHFVFVTASVVLLVTLTIWCGMRFAAGGDAGFLLGGLGSVAGVGLLAPYAVWVRRKLQDVGYW